MITLDEYAAKIVRPMIIDGIKLGRFDDVLADPDVLRIAIKDQLVETAIIDRIKELAKKRKEKASLFSSIGLENELFKHANFKVGDTLRIRLPK